MPITFADLPSELVIHIFSDACTDSGFTGCSLSLVSKDFRALCLYNGVDVQCAALYGFQRMAKFVDMLKKRDKSARKVTHLFITDCRASVLQLPVGDSAFPKLTFNEHESLLARQTLECLLQTISSNHLRTFAIYIPRYTLSTSTSHSIFSRPFPSLTELSLYAGLNRPFFEDFRPTPSLKRLNIASYTVLPADVGVGVSRIAPNLTHLRVSLRTPRSYFSNIRDVIKNYVEDFSPPTPLLTGPPCNFPTNPSGDIPPSLNVGELPRTVNTFIIAFNPLYKAAVGNMARRNIQYYTDVEWVKQAAPLRSG